MTSEASILTPQGLLIDFGNGVRESHDLPPYQEIAPGMVVGYEQGTGATCSCLHDETERRIIIDIQRIGASRWLTFEYALDHQALIDTKMAVWSATMTSTPRSAYRLDLRMWVGEDGTFVDFVVGRGVTSAVKRRLRDVFVVEGEAEHTLAHCTGARFIQVLPLGEASFSVSNILCFPWLSS